MHISLLCMSNISQSAPANQSHPAKKEKFYGAYVSLSNLLHFLFRFSNIVIERVRMALVQAPQCWARRTVLEYAWYPCPQSRKVFQALGVIRSLLSHLQNLKAQRLAKNKVMELGPQRLKESAATQMWDFSFLVQRKNLHIHYFDCHCSEVVLLVNI